MKKFCSHLKFGQGLIGTACLCFTWCQLEWLEGQGLQSTESSLTCLEWRLAVGWDLSGAVSWNTYMWPFHVTCTSSQHCIWVTRASILRDSCGSHTRGRCIILYGLVLEVIATFIFSKQQKAPPKFKVRQIFHLLMEGGNILEEHLSPEITLQIFF